MGFTMYLLNDLTLYKVDSTAPVYKVDSTAHVHQLLGSRKSALQTENLLLKELNFVDEVNDQRADNVVSLHYNVLERCKISQKTNS